MLDKHNRHSCPALDIQTEQVDYVFMNNIPLEPGETVTAVFRLHPIVLVAPILVAVSLSIGAAVALWVGIRFGMPFVLAGAVLFGLAATALLIGLHTYAATKLVLTNIHVFSLFKDTLFSETLTTIALAQVTNSRGIQAGITQSVFQYGAVTIQTQGGTLDFLKFQPVARPEFVAVAINDAHEAFVRANPYQSV